jgi:hypothetical protein
MSFDQLAAAIRRRRVVAGLVERSERCPDLPADRLVRLSRPPADRQDGGVGLLGEGGSLHAGANEDERSGGRIAALAVELEDGSAAQYQVELLVLLRLVVLVDDPIAHGATPPRVHAERRDAEVVSHGPPGTASVRQLRDLVQPLYGEIAHSTSFVDGRSSHRALACSVGEPPPHGAQVALRFDGDASAASAAADKSDKEIG